MIYDLWDIFILGKTRYSPHRTGIVYAPHRRGSGIVWVLENDTLDTYPDLFHKSLGIIFVRYTREWDECHNPKHK